MGIREKNPAQVPRAEYHEVVDALVPFGKKVLVRGCDPRVVMPITGHRSEADQRRRAATAIKKLERKRA